MGQSKEAVMADEITDQETTTEEPAGKTLEELQAENVRIAAALTKANKEAEARRKKLDAIEAAEAARQQAAMTETDRLKAELEAERAKSAQADERARQTLIRAAFVSEAAKAGAAYPEDVHRLADLSGVDVDESGAVTGVTEAVKSLVDAGRIPMAGKTPAPNLDGGAGGNDRPGQTVKLTPLEMELAKKMGLSAEQYQKSKAASIAARSD
jgi:hypothetical protein